MDRITTLTKENERLKIQQEKAKKIISREEANISSANKQLCLNYKKIAEAYQDFYTRKANKEFVLYERFPSLSALKECTSEFHQFPLYEYGSLNIKELAEIIKYLYQFKTGKEYDIFTIGDVYQLGMHPSSSTPHLYFMIGNDATLAPYQNYNGTFSNNRIDFNDKPLKNMVMIDAEESFHRFDSIRIECFTESGYDKVGLLNYFNEHDRKYAAFRASKYKQIFSSYIPSKLNYSGGHKIKGIKDVMDFEIHPFDSYIARVLISIVIYKKNNNIQELSNDDYNHIFDVLFGEKVQIVEDVKKDIPRRLLYVPNERTDR